MPFTEISSFFGGFLENCRDFYFTCFFFIKTLQFNSITLLLINERNKSSSIGTIHYILYTFIIVELLSNNKRKHNITTYAEGEQVKIKNCKIKINVYVLVQIMNIKSVNVSHWGHNRHILCTKRNVFLHVYEVCRWTCANDCWWAVMVSLDIAEVPLRLSISQVFFKCV